MRSICNSRSALKFMKSKLPTGKHIRTMAMKPFVEKSDLKAPLKFGRFIFLSIQFSILETCIIWLNFILAFIPYAYFFSAGDSLIFNSDKSVILFRKKLVTNVSIQLQFRYRFQNVLFCLCFWFIIEWNFKISSS